MYKAEKLPATPTEKLELFHDSYLPPLKGSPQVSAVRPHKRPTLMRQDASIYDANTRCGLGSCKPDCLQQYTTTSCYLAVYCYLGLVQGMYYTYFLSVISTIEKRFGISSKYAGLLMSGNDIAQILSSLFLAYYGGRGNRPRWMAGGMLCTSIALVLMAVPHFIYGGGSDAIQATTILNSTKDISLLTQHSLCNAAINSNDYCEEGKDMWGALIIIFLSLGLQGAGSTCYYSLGLPYLDDNSKPSQLPAFLGVNGGIRVLGPFFGFCLGYACLRFYISPNNVPDNMDVDDPRWLGAWWTGFLVIGALLLLGAFAVLLFPSELPKTKARRLKVQKGRLLSVDSEDEAIAPTNLKDMMKSIGRLLKNRLVVVSLFSAVLTFFGYMGFYTFMAKYVELQFRISSADSSLYTGLANVLVQVVGYALAAIVIKIWKPSSSKVALWCVFIGIVEVAGFLGIMQVYCPDLKLNGIVQKDSSINITSACTVGCNCTTEYYNPVCHLETNVTYYSPCYAGCPNAVNEDDRAAIRKLDFVQGRPKRSLIDKKEHNYIYYGCSCLDERHHVFNDRLFKGFHEIPSEEEFLKSKEEMSRRMDSRNMMFPHNRANVSGTSDRANSRRQRFIRDMFDLVFNVNRPVNRENLEENEILTNRTYNVSSSSKDGDLGDSAEANLQPFSSTIKMQEDSTEKSNTEPMAPRSRANNNDHEQVLHINKKVSSGFCDDGCDNHKWYFIGLGALKALTSTSRVGGMLIIIRAVVPADKSMLMGIFTFAVSAFSFIPCPIVYGAIIDTTCVIWKDKCGEKANCAFYDMDLFRTYLHGTSAAILAVALIFDVLVYLFAKELHLYGEEDNKSAQENGSEVKNASS